MVGVLPSEKWDNRSGYVFVVGYVLRIPVLLQAKDWSILTVAWPFIHNLLNLEEATVAWHVGGVGHQPPLGGEDRAGEVGRGPQGDGTSALHKRGEVLADSILDGRRCGPLPGLGGHSGQ